MQSHRIRGRQGIEPADVQRNAEMVFWYLLRQETKEKGAASVASRAEMTLGARCARIPLK